MRTVGIVLDHHRHPLDDGDPQRRRIFALHPRGRDPPDGGHPLGHGVGVDLQQRCARFHRGGVDDLVLAHLTQSRHDDAARGHHRGEVQQQAEAYDDHADHRSPHQRLQAPNRSAAKLFRLVRRPTNGTPLGLATPLLDRGCPGLGRAPLFTFPALPSPRSLVVGSRCGRCRFWRLFRLGGWRLCLRGRLLLLTGIRRVGVARLGHRRAVPDRPGELRLAFSCSDARISAPSMVTSPAPMVTTTSPGCAVSATFSATAEKSAT